MNTSSHIPSHTNETSQENNVLVDEVIRTPLVRYQGPLAAGSQLWLKDETRQIGGSFKFRGTYARLLREPSGSLVVTASTGNHGIGVAYAAQKLGIRVHIFVPTHTSRIKIEKVTQLGASVDKIVGGYDECVKEALTFAQERGISYISSLDDPYVIQGHASLFKEVQEQGPADLDALLLPVGGGGLLAGCLEAYQGWATPIIGVELACVPSMQLALTSNERVLLPAASSCAEGMLVRQAGALPFVKARAAAHLSIELVEEEEIWRAMHLLWLHNTIRAEGAGASAMAVALRHLEQKPGLCMVAVISGGNVDDTLFQAVMAKDV